MADRSPILTHGFRCADLRDYTGYVERHGDLAAALLGRFRALVRAAVAETASAEIRTEGDSVDVVRREVHRILIDAATTGGAPPRHAGRAGRRARPGRAPIPSIIGANGLPVRRASARRPPTGPSISPCAACANGPAFRPEPPVETAAATERNRAR